MFTVLPLVVALSCWSVATETPPFDFATQTSHGFVNVRPNAHMFWWFFYAAKLTPTGFLTHAHSEKFPIIIWLQGGPGGSSTGFGNFELIGPLDNDLEIRNNSWIQYANLLFIDNPVGTGYSYVTQNDAFATDNEIIAHDLLVLLTQFYAANPTYQNSPLYIFSESYGGKMAVTLTRFLWRAQDKGQIKCNLKGLVLGDPWISPLDSVATWPDYLKSLSLIDQNQFDDLNHRTMDMKNLLDAHQFVNATKLWSQLESVIRNYTYRVNFYNVMKHDVPVESFPPRLAQCYDGAESAVEPDLFLYKLGYFYENDLETLMNTQVRNILGIPNNVIWGSQILDVFQNLLGDFMLSVFDDVDYIVKNLPIKVVVYNGQWDLIVNILGTTKWVNRLQFDSPEHAHNFKVSPKKILGKENDILGFYKTHGKFSFYWILNSGHMVPKDACDAALKMLFHILELPH